MSPPIQTSSYSETYTSDKWLEDEGVDLSDPLNKQLTTYSNQLEGFNANFLNGIAEPSQYAPYLEIVKQAFPVLTSNKDKLADELIYSVLREITRTVAIISRKMDDVSNQDFLLIQSISEFAFEYISKHDLLQDPGDSPSNGYSPTPRIEAAESLLYLFIRNKSQRSFDLLLQAANNSNSIVRFNAIRNIQQLFHTEYERYLEIMIPRLRLEEDSFIYAALLGNIRFKKDKVREQAPAILQTIYEKENFFKKHNSFLENYVRLLLSLYKYHEVQEAYDILVNAYDRPDFCKTIIFELFDSMHPSFAPDDKVYKNETALNLIKIIRHYVTVAGEILIKIDPTTFTKENAEGQNALLIIDKIIQRIYFQLTPKKIGNHNAVTLAVNDDNKRAFYFLIKPIFTDIIGLSSRITARGLITGHTAHYFIQSLNQVIPYDAKEVLSQAANITRFSMQTGYTFDSSAIREIVILTESLLADHRSLLLEPDSFQHLIDLLDIYIQSGWVDALELLWKLDEVFK